MGAGQQLAPVERELPQQRELGRRAVDLLARETDKMADEDDVVDVGDLDDVPLAEVVTCTPLNSASSTATFLRLPTLLRR